MRLRLNDTVIKPKIDLDPGGVKYADPSLFAILASNLFTLGLAITLNWPLGEIMWIYWSQSVAIGVTNFIRLHSLKDFSTRGMTMNGQPVPETASGKRGVANFFALHYGLFHLVYMGFLWEAFSPFSLPVADLSLFLLSIGLFAASHVYSLIYNRKQDLRSRKQNIGTLMFYPYLRIIPMHLTICIGGAVGAGAFWLFMGLKTVADMGMHMIEHALFRQPTEGLQVTGQD